jgi:hypothetical protein
MAVAALPTMSFAAGLELAQTFCKSLGVKDAQRMALALLERARAA